MWQNLWEIGEKVVGASNPLAGFVMDMIGDIIFESEETEANTVGELAPNLIKLFEDPEIDSLDVVRSVVDFLPCDNEMVNTADDLLDVVKNLDNPIKALIEVNDFLSNFK